MIDIINFNKAITDYSAGQRDRGKNVRPPCQNPMERKRGGEEGRKRRGGEFEERRRGGGEERITREGEVSCGGYEERRGGVEEGGGMEPRGVERRRGEEGKMSKGGEEEIS